MPHHPINNGFALHIVLKILTILTVKSSHQWYLLLLGNLASQSSCCERAMSMHQLKVHLFPLAHKWNIQKRQAVSIWRSEWDRN